MSKYRYTTEKAINDAFWKNNPQYNRMPGRTQNDYKCDIRCAYVEWLDMRQKDGEISEKLADRVTLS